MVSSFNEEVKSPVSTFKYKITVKKPTSNKSNGSYENLVKIKLKTETKGATIYYTIDGTTPTSKSKKYTGAITVSKDTTIKAIAMKGATKSSVSSFEYDVREIQYLEENKVYKFDLDNDGKMEEIFFNYSEEYYNEEYGERCPLCKIFVNGKLKQSIKLWGFDSVYIADIDAKDGAVNIFVWEGEINKLTAAKNISFYKKASTSSGIAFTVKKGEKVQVVSLYCSGSKVFVKFKNSKGRIGWLREDNVRWDDIYFSDAVSAG